MMLANHMPALGVLLLFGGFCLWAAWLLYQDRGPGKKDEFQD